MKSSPKHKLAPRKGFLLMEALLAFSIFGIAVTSIVVAINRTAEISYNIAREARTQSQLKSLLTEVLTMPISEIDFERDEIVNLAEAGTSARIQVSQLENIYANQDSTQEALRQLYSVKITLKWEEDGVDKTKVVETTHYYPLYSS